jgi:predicted transposase/invertase (TIGR01784 family)
MEQKPLSPTNDFVFKKVFGENMTVLTDFLKSVLDLPDDEYQGLIVVDPHLSRDSMEDKLGILDIKIKTRSRKTIDVEVQVRAQPSIWKRMQYYTANMYVGQVQSGNKYDQLTNAISILIADFVLIKENDEYHNRFRLYDERTKTHFPDSIEVNTLEIPKVRESDRTKLSDWLTFFAAKTEEEFMTVSQKNPAIAEAWGVIKTLSADERSRLLAESREKGRMDFEDRWDGAYRDGMKKGKLEGELEGEQKGLQKGLQEGLQKGKFEVARNALRDNMPINMIAKITGLSLSEIERLAGDK